MYPIGLFIFFAVIYSVVCDPLLYLEVTNAIMVPGAARA
jgi:hypothetical protein